MTSKFLKNFTSRKTQQRAITLLAAIAIFGFILWQHFWEERQSKFLPDRTIASEVYDFQPIQAIPEYIPFDRNKVKLGDKLFHDSRLSRDNTVSCASCHDLKTGGCDLRVSSIGINGAVGTINSPTVFNSGFNFRQFWDARAESIEELINAPLTSPTEMGSNWKDIIDKLQRYSEYASLFDRAYSDGIKKENITDALAIFVQSLYTPNSRFDRFLLGRENAITNEEKEGYRHFKSYGCISCHQGINIGGNMLHTFGVMSDFIEARSGEENRYLDKADRNKLFKVPSLRNVALTPPYFHNGSAKTLEEAVEIMGRYQLGRNIPPADVDLIVKFLKTLTGEYQGKSL